MKRVRSIVTAAAVAGLLALAPASLLAGEMCGLTTFLDEIRAGVKHEGFSSMCIAGQGCSIFSEKVDGHRLQLARRDGEKEWLVLLNVPAEADISEGVELTVDKGEAMRVPPEFLEARAAGRAIAISNKLTGVVLPELKKGEALKWAYVLKSGKRQVVNIPLKGFGKVAGWAECAIRTLDDMARGK